MIIIFYAFRDEVESIGIQEARSCDFVIGYISVAELNDVAGLFDLPKTVPSTVSVGISNACAVFRLEECTMYIKKRAFIIAPDNPKQSLPFLQGMLSRLGGAGEPSSVRACCLYLDEMLISEQASLAKIRQELARLEEQILDGNHSRNINRVLYCKKQICLEKSNYFGTLLDAVDELKEGLEIDGDDIKCLDVLYNKLGHQRDSVRMVIESIVQLRDAYQAAIDLRLNNNMKVFTIVTVIFAPLSFITGWFGMNFRHMPLLSSPYGTAVTCAVCVIIAVAMVVWFKRRG